MKCAYKQGMNWNECMHELLKTPKKIFVEAGFRNEKCFWVVSGGVNAARK